MDFVTLRSQASAAVSYANGAAKMHADADIMSQLRVQQQQQLATLALHVGRAGVRAHCSMHQGLRCGLCIRPSLPCKPLSKAVELALPIQQCGQTCFCCCCQCAAQGWLAYV